MKSYLFSILAFLILYSVNGFGQHVIQVSDSAGCPPFNVDFSTNIPNASSYYWDFGNGQTSTLHEPSVVYTDTGSYSVSLIVNTSNGQQIVLTENNIIQVKPKPIADFSYIQSGNCQGSNSVSFTNNSSFGNNYTWDFGDGVQSNLQDPLHTYNSHGQFQAHLSVVNDIGCVGQFTSNPIIIDPTPSVSLHPQLTDTCVLLQPLNFSAIGAYSNLQWNIDSSQYTGNTIQHSFNIGGWHDITIISDNAFGCIDTFEFQNAVHIDPPTCNVRIAQGTSCVGDSLKLRLSDCHNWQNANVDWYVNGVLMYNGTPFYFKPNLAGTYLIRAEYMINGCGSFKERTVTINNPQQVQVLMSDSTACVGEVVSPSVSNAYFSNVAWYTNNNTYSGYSPQLTYTQPGYYTITTEARDTNGCYSIDSLTLAVSEPIAALQIDTLSGCAPLNINLNNLSSNGNYSLSTGDGTHLNYIPGNYVYMSPGNYNIELTVVDSNACIDQLPHPINVNVYSSELSIQPTEITGCAPYNLSLNNYGIGYDTWLWDFGDGSSSTMQYPNHTYSVPGQYIVSLTTNNLYGCQSIIDSVFVINIVEPIQLAMFDSLDCYGFTLSIDSNLINNALWTFDGVAMDSSASFSYPALDNAYHNISLIYADTNACVSQLSQNYFLAQCSGGFVGSGSPPIPGAGFGGFVDTVNVCSPYIFNTGLLSLPNGSNLIELNMGDGSSYTSFGALHTFDSLGYFTIHATINTNGIIDTLQYYQVFNVTSYDIQSTISTTQMSCDSVQFILQNTGASYNLWEFSQGQQYLGDSISFNVASQFYSESVDLTAFNSYGCVDFAQYNLNINAQGEVFSVDKLACVQELVTFEAFTSNNVSWQFSDGVTLSGDIVQRSFGNPGVYALNIVTTDANNCVKTYVYDSIVVNGVSNDILVSDHHLCTSDTAIVSFMSGVGASTWYVNGLSHGNADSLRLSSPSTSIYAIELVSFFEGCESISYDTVIVHEINASMNSVQDRKCYPMTVSFNSTTTGAVDWNWRFGDGTYSQGVSSTSHTYNGSPTQTAKLYVTDAFGCVDSTSNGWFNTWSIDAQASQTNGCAPLGVSFTLPNTVQSAEWSFGDGNFAQSVNASHTYTIAGVYDPSVTTTMVDGCIDTLYLGDQITVNKATANASINYTAGCAPIQASFNSTGSIGDYFEWNFGDGSSSVIQNPNHLYNTGGAFQVSLIVSDVNGCSDTSYIQNSVNVYNPIADFSVNQITVCIGDTLNLLNHSTNASSLMWHFGDGTTSSQIAPNQVYSDTGDYQIVLSVSDTMGCTSSMIMDSMIHVVSRPNASFTINDSVFCLGDSIHIGSLIAHNYYEEWTLDGQVLQTFSWLNLDTGSHVIGHFMSNGYCSDYFESTYYVNAPLDASINAPATICQSDTILTLSAASPGGFWSGLGISDSLIGTANISNAPIGVHALYYNIGGECPTIDSAFVEIVTMPNATITLDSVICENHGFIAIGSSSQNDIWTLNGSLVSDSIDISSAPGMHTLIHTIDNGTCMDSDTMSIEVIAKPIAHLEVFNDIYCFGESDIAYLELSDTSCHVAWEYTSINGADTIVSSSLNVPYAGEWNISATITNEIGCQSTVSGSSFTVLDSITPELPEIIRSTVVNDEFVYTEWALEDQNDINKFTAYVLYRRDSIEWTEVAVLPPYKLSYSDYNVDVHTANYEYKLVTIQRCTNTRGNSLSNSILLEHDKVEGMDRFKWNPYIQWEDGVNRYELQYLRNDGTWETIEVMNSESTESLR